MWQNVRSKVIFLPMLASLLICSPARSDVSEILKTVYGKSPVMLQGRLFFGKCEGNGIDVWDGKQTTSFWKDEHCGPTSIVEYRERGNNHLLVACYYANSLVELDMSGKEIRRIDRDNKGKPFTGPNLITSDGAGGYYFSASGAYNVKAPITGTVMHLKAHSSRPVEVANTIHYSNGLTLTADKKNLLVAEMFAGRILSFPVREDGSLGTREVWARLQDLAPPTPEMDAYNGPDGLRLGSDGNYYIAQSGSGRVLVVSADKKLVRIITVPSKYVTDIGFGEHGADEVFVYGAFEQWKAPFPAAIYVWKK